MPTLLQDKTVAIAAHQPCRTRQGPEDRLVWAVRAPVLRFSPRPSRGALAAARPAREQPGSIRTVRSLRGVTQQLTRWRIANRMPRLACPCRSRPLSAGPSPESITPHQYFRESLTTRDADRPTALVYLGTVTIPLTMDRCTLGDCPIKAGLRSDEQAGKLDNELRQHLPGIVLRDRACTRPMLADELRRAHSSWVAAID